MFPTGLLRAVPRSGRQTEMCDAWLPAHAVKGVSKALLSRMANVKAGRYEGAAFTRHFIDEALRTRRKVFDLEGR